MYNYDRVRQTKTLNIAGVAQLVEQLICNQ